MALSARIIRFPNRASSATTAAGRRAESWAPRTVRGLHVILQQSTLSRALGFTPPLCNVTRRSVSTPPCYVPAPRPRTTRLFPRVTGSTDPALGHPRCHAAVPSTSPAARKPAGRRRATGRRAGKDVKPARARGPGGGGGGARNFTSASLGR
ncbi:hypothetical protein EJ06DRAFT_255946 [Trichodelitschia bisporula]|uniref:Uncharacterized protein n=1 Tax=Trichodelitschia bisporula TaxID=703511 RepID=A0A6G1HIV1_9PEZI|nr:hypothetical protein EJ06DRAFT_255946 [Trichodelitschia bisporula]